MVKEDLLSFFRALILNPRATGAVLPSSKFLAKEMASHAIGDGIVLELGAGTGVITEALIGSGVLPENIIVIEFSPQLVKNLRNRFPSIKIIEGDAIHLIDLMANESRQVSSIISSLPLRSLSKSVSRSILEKINEILPVGGRYIQFTYGINQDLYDPLTHCEYVFSKWIWPNFPPARVDVWVKKSSGP